MALSRQETLKILGAMKDEDIDDSDAPKTDAEFWKGAEIHVPSGKVSVNMRIDADVVEWFKARQAKGYQTLMNFVLRSYMQHHQEKARLTREQE